MKNKILGLIAVLALGCGAQDDGYDDDSFAGEAGSASIGQVEQPLTTQRSTGGGLRISGYVSSAEGRNDEAIQCVQNMSTSANCVQPRTLANIDICFTAAADASPRIRAQTIAVANALNGYFNINTIPPINAVHVLSGTTNCAANGVRIDKLALANDGLPVTDIRHYGKFTHPGASILSEPVAIPGTFQLMIAGVSSLVVDESLIMLQSSNSTIRDRMVHHTIAHHLIRRFGLGTAGSTQSATHMSNTLNNDTVFHNTLDVAQTCLVKNLGYSDLTTYRLSASAGCPSFPNGM